ncbi:D-glucuronate isomerase [Abditibacterium utsteinense]|uniref:Uronate isomerase n=1 Tax=Abditibacterium utsteinense TaxID=1960156 RepID=A0A2S8SRW0_9BACT|nr:glucuronate isomerase [Abditibacterium utsteinense]PQV63543.1 D-glucuronate isomerase [Abditibacterium utsteinense]
MKPFIHEDFLLQSESARRLYHDFARDEPILDYHNHLSPRDIALNRRFDNLGELWLEGDHYKWRAMRADGIPERFCTGDASPREKFMAWASVVPHTLRNPLFHWTHLELKRYFGIDEFLNEETAPAIWERANEQLQNPELSTQGILKQFRVRALCTTDDPAQALNWHQQIADSGLETRVYPTFRPDQAFNVDKSEAFKSWLGQLGTQVNLEISTFPGFLDALDKRHADFHALGCRLSDHGIGQAFADFPTEREAAEIFNRAFQNQTVSAPDRERFASFLMLFLGHLDARRGWTKQLHIGAKRNNNPRRFAELGADSGFDSLDDLPQAQSLAAYLGRLEAENALPKMVIYNLNPADNYLFATMAGNFQDGENGGVAGKIQFGSGWWFLDQKEAMEWQLNALSNNGLLFRFIGMLTDSRSFASFPRHEYFRRVLCNLVGRDMERGELPGDFEMVGKMIRGICYANARDYLGLETGEMAVRDAL